MFGNGKSKRNADIDSLIGGNTKIQGDIYFTGGLHIDGVVEGNIVANDENSMLTTSEKGRIEGDVTVHHIVLNGEVVGDVHSLEHIELAANARVTGNVYYNIIEMTMGAEVNGNLIHTEKDGQKSDAGAANNEQQSDNPENRRYDESGEPRSKIA
jgi:cytoskeletal protein CcmA (bactofilin family)